MQRRLGNLVNRLRQGARNVAGRIAANQNVPGIIRRAASAVRGRLAGS